MLQGDIQKQVEADGHTTPVCKAEPQLEPRGDSLGVSGHPLCSV